MGKIMVSWRMAVRTAGAVKKSYERSPMKKHEKSPMKKEGDVGK